MSLNKMLFRLTQISNTPRYRKLQVTVAQDLTLKLFGLNPLGPEPWFMPRCEKLIVIFLVLWVL